MGVSGVQQGAQDAALGGADVEGAAAEVPNSDLQHLCSAGQKVQDQSRAKSSGPDPWALLKTEHKVTPVADLSCCAHHNDFRIPVRRLIGV